MFSKYEKPPVYFHLSKNNFRFDERKKLKRFIAFLVKKEKKELVFLNYIFCDDRFLLKINREYLNHDFYTDIISFDLSDSSANILGEIYISIDRVRENAKNFNNTFKEELHRVLFHGILHLCDYKDKTPKEIGLMRKKENLYLNLYKRFT